LEKARLGTYPTNYKIKQREDHLAEVHRALTGEPKQSWIRRLIREYWDAKDLS